MTRRPSPAPLRALDGAARSTRPNPGRAQAATLTVPPTDPATVPGDQTGLWRRRSLPRVHGGYVLEERVGVGGMGVVYRAKDLNGAPVAIKILSEHLMGRDGEERFRREIGALQRLDHPHIVRLLDHGVVNDEAFYAMELVDGPDLTKLVEHEGPQPASRVATILRQLADALVHAHRRGFIHRDIKPSNVVVRQTDDGHTAKLLDFGLVLPQEKRAVRLTANDMLLGTPGYIAPEGAISAHLLSERSDVYALGLIAFYLRTGAHLFRPADIVSGESHRRARARGWKLLRDAGGLPGPVERAVWRALRFDPERRPPSARTLVDAVDATELPAREASPRWLGSLPRDGGDRAHAASMRPQLIARKSALCTCSSSTPPAA